MENSYSASNKEIIRKIISILIFSTASQAPFFTKLHLKDFGEKFLKT